MRVVTHRRGHAPHPPPPSPPPARRPRPLRCPPASTASGTLLRSRARVVARARSWGVTSRPFADLDELLALAGHGTARTPRPTPCSDGSSTSPASTSWRPGWWCSDSSRDCWRSSGGVGPTASFEELIGAAWLAIRAYRTDRRPERIAANLVHDAAYAAFIAPQAAALGVGGRDRPAAVRGHARRGRRRLVRGARHPARRGPRGRAARPRTSNSCATSCGWARRRSSPPSAR